MSFSYSRNGHVSLSRWILVWLGVLIVSIPVQSFYHPALTYITTRLWYYINITFFTGWHCSLSPRGNIGNRGGAEVDNAFRGDDNLLCQPVKIVIFILLYRMSHFYNKFHRRYTLPCDIQNCYPANWPIKLLEINMRYNNTKHLRLKVFIEFRLRVNISKMYQKYQIRRNLFEKSSENRIWLTNGL